MKEQIEIWVDPEVRVAEAIKRLTYAEMMLFAEGISECLLAAGADIASPGDIAGVLDAVAGGIIEAADREATE